ncbi:MAG: hypothetical protein QOK36_24 [Gaiellales bacterium]|nr:hypothetical protein [Gaiellales bacterium]
MATPVTSDPAGAPPPPPRVHRRRFAIFYAGLAVLLAAGVAASVHLITRKVVKPAPWSAWAPLKGDSPESTVREIAVHVQGAYKDAAKKDYATVRGGPLSVGSDPAVLVKPDSKSTGGYKFFTGASVEYQICANSKSGTCAFTSNKTLTPNQSGAITRRMAYELALTTFHYVPEVQNVAVLLPVVQKGQKARILVLTRADNKDPKSLRSVLVPLSAKQPSNQEATEIAKLTDPLIYHYEVTATSNNQPVYLITPLLIKDTAATKSSMP